MLHKAVDHVKGKGEAVRCEIYHITQIVMQFKTHLLFISRIFHLIFLDQSLKWNHQAQS